MELKNIQRGARNKASGARFEQALDAAFGELARLGVANVQKTPEPMRVVGRSNKPGLFTAIYTQAAQPDYQGTLAGGRSVVLEAKFTCTDKVQMARVSDEQARQLDLHAELGAFCGVLLCFSGVFAFVPWREWADIPSRCGHKHVTLADAERLGYVMQGQLIGALERLLG